MRVDRYVSGRGIKLPASHAKIMEQIYPGGLKGCTVVPCGVEGLLCGM